MDFKVTALSRSNVMRLSYDGIDLNEATKDQKPDWPAFSEEKHGDQVQKADLETLTEFLANDFNGNRVVVDCSDAQDVADYYATWMRQGIHVVSTNKKAGAGALEKYDENKQLSGARAQWFYETTAPGSGLPL